MCTHIKGGLQLKDVVIQAMLEALWKKLGETIEMLKNMIKL
jgi:hypothetical protein